MSFIEYSDIESRRFNLKVYRGVVDRIEPFKLLRTAIDNRVDVIIIRIPVEKQNELVKIEDTGFPYLVADTLVYYHAELSRLQPKSLRNQELEFIELTPELFETLDNLVCDIFRGYRNHYNVNPLFNIDLTEAYKEWARSFGEKNTKGKRGWIVRRNKTNIGFATCKSDNKSCEGVLYGIVPGASGGGIYTDLIRFTQIFFKRLGCNTMKVSTQVNNFAVQKVWSREGFAMKETFITAHVISLMNASFGPVRQIKVCLSEKKIPVNDYLTPTMLMNLIWQEMTRLLIEAFPRRRLQMNRGSFKLLRELDVNVSYNMNMHFPVINLSKGTGKARFEITGRGNKLHLFLFLDIKIV